MAFAAALCGRPLWAMSELHRLLDADKQNAAPPEPQTIRKLASQIVASSNHPRSRRLRRGALNLQPRVRSASRGNHGEVRQCLRCRSLAQFICRTPTSATGSALPEDAAGSGFGMSDSGVVIDLSAMEQELEANVIRQTSGPRRGWRSRS